MSVHFLISFWSLSSIHYRIYFARVYVTHLFIFLKHISGNNVGRNAFRIFQVQRAFSDAHRALVAALEWEDTYSSSGNDAALPLLKCLLHSEDVVYDL